MGSEIQGPRRSKGKTELSRSSKDPAEAQQAPVRGPEPSPFPGFTPPAPEPAPVAPPSQPSVETVLTPRSAANSASSGAAQSPPAAVPQLAGTAQGVQTSRPVLAWLFSPDRTRFWPLFTGGNRIGRADDRDVIIPDPSISRRQCTIRLSESEVVLQPDSESRAETYVRGDLIIRETSVPSNCELRFGEATFFLVRLDVPESDED